MKKSSAFAVILTLSSSLYAVDGAEIYKQCAGCHGEKGDLKYHYKASPIIKISKERRLKALEGYKYGTQSKYGMGSAMSDQVKHLSMEELIAVNDFIESLKDSK
ncbi:c-type cytochrome [Campylobacter sp. MOP51]|uniref:c-type cytochrome n=1 Tax=Campylobacter canis TaxID=3378588 RepID=UPI003C37AD91